ncbi:MAG TPA: c-type cytochrome domain-containing protein [Isosphaeraceae bacterium]
MTRMVRRLAVAGLVAASGVGLMLASSGATRALGQEPKTATKKKTKTAKKAPAKPAMTEAPAPAGDGGLKFSKDIAPILVANCSRCHSPETPQYKRSNLSVVSFESLMKGGKSGQDIEPGNPAESTLVQRIIGEGGARMPPGQNPLGEGAIAKITQWVKEGATLDAGVDAKAPMAKYAASPEDLRRAELAKMPAAERDKKTEAVAVERLKKADPNASPDLTTSAHFLLYAQMPKDRATNLLKTMEAQHGRIGRLLAGTKGLPGPEKIGLYVFKERKGYTEFVRTVENQDVEAGDEARSKLNVESPYVLAIDPVAGGAEPAPSTAKKSTRSKKGSSDDMPGGAERTLAGLLTEQLASGALAQAGKPPRWVTMGVGALISSSVERSSPYYRKLRSEAYTEWSQGWATKATEALGDQTKPEAVRAVGFAIAEWISTAAPDALPYFLKGMFEGGEKLDDVIVQCLQGNREAFLAGSGEFVGANYGRGR